MNEIIQKAIRGDAKSFEKLCDLKGRTIIYLCIKNMGNIQDGEDAAQETFIRLQKRIGSLKDPLAFEKWLYILIQSTCTDMKRKLMKIKKNVSIEEFEDYIEDNDINSAPQKLLENIDDSENILKIVDKMPKNMRMCVILYYYESLPQAEIAEILSLSVTTVKSNLYKARLFMKDELVENNANSTEVGESSNMAFLGILLQEEAKVLVPESLIKSCSAVAVATSASAVGIGTVATGLLSKSLIGTLLIPVTVVGLGVGVVAFATSLKASTENTSMPILISTSENAPQRTEQVEQNSAKDESTVDEQLVASSSEMDEKDEETQTDKEAGSNSSEPQKNNEIELSTLKGKVQLVGRNGELLESSLSNLKGLEVNLILGEKKVASTFTNASGEYSFDNLKIDTGEYQVVVELTKNNEFFFSRDAKYDSEIVFLESGKRLENHTVYIVDDISPRVALTLYDAEGRPLRTNPKQLEINIQDATQTNCKLTVYSPNTSTPLYEGSSQQIDRFLAGNLEIGRYTINAEVTDAAGNKTMEQIEFYIV